MLDWLTLACYTRACFCEKLARLGLVARGMVLNADKDRLSRD